ncbi:MAG: hypothetical protein AB1797_02260 [bacterium]
MLDKIDKIQEILERLAVSQEKTDEELKKLTESQKETDEDLKKLAESQKKTDEELRDLSKEVSKLTKSDEILRKQLGEFTNSWGKFVEGMVAPSVPEIFKHLGIEVLTLYQRALKHKKGEEMEIDILCRGRRDDGREIIIVTEAKSTFEVEDINEFVERLMEFKEFFDEYREQDVVGVTAGTTFRQEVRKYAQRKGLYVLVPSGEIMKLWNKPDFKPKIWNGQAVDES